MLHQHGGVNVSQCCSCRGESPASSPSAPPESKQGLAVLCFRRGHSFMIKLHQELFPVPFAYWFLAPSCHCHVDSRGASWGGVPEPHGSYGGDRSPCSWASSASKSWVAVGDTAEWVNYKRGAKDAFDRGWGCERMGGRAMKHPQISLSNPPLGFAGRSIKEEEVNRGSLPGCRPAQQGSVAFGYSVWYWCRCAGSLRHWVDFLRPANWKGSRQQTGYNRYELTGFKSRLRLITELRALEKRNIFISLIFI